MMRASSSVAPAVTQPGKSGNDTPYSEPLSLWIKPIYCISCSPQVQTGLSLDALQRSDWNLFRWMRDRHAPFLQRMLELNMAADLVHNEPAVSPKRGHDVPTVHSVYLYTRTQGGQYPVKGPARRTHILHLAGRRRCRRLYRRARPRRWVPPCG